MQLKPAKAAGPASPAGVIDVNESNFEREVLTRSQEVPVVIDFWAPWCAPCRTLGPVLEKLAAEARGAFILAKINVDENQRIAAAFRVQGIPAVKAVRDGKIIDEFTGALPESRVREWLKRFVTAPAAPQPVALVDERDPQQAIAHYRAMLADDPQDAGSRFALARLLLRQGDPEAITALREVPSGSPFFARAQLLIENQEFFRQANPDETTDLAARYRRAAYLVRQGEDAAALDQLLYIIQRDRTLFDDGARKAMLAILAMLGDDNPLVSDYRRRLANTLF